MNNKLIKSVGIIAGSALIIGASASTLANKNDQNIFTMNKKLSSEGIYSSVIDNSSVLKIHSTEKLIDSRFYDFYSDFSVEFQSGEPFIKIEGINEMIINDPTALDIASLEYSHDNSNWSSVAIDQYLLKTDGYISLSNLEKEKSYSFRWNLTDPSFSWGIAPQTKELFISSDENKYITDNDVDKLLSDIDYLYDINMPRPLENKSKDFSISKRWSFLLDTNNKINLLYKGHDQEEKDYSNHNWSSPLSLVAGKYDFKFGLKQGFYWKNTNRDNIQLNTLNFFQKTLNVNPIHNIDLNVLSSNTFDGTNNSEIELSLNSSNPIPEYFDIIINNSDNNNKKVYSVDSLNQYGLMSIVGLPADNYSIYLEINDPLAYSWSDDIKKHSLSQQFSIKNKYESDIVVEEDLSNLNSIIIDDSGNIVIEDIVNNLDERFDIKYITTEDDQWIDLDINADYAKTSENNIVIDTEESKITEIKWELKSPFTLDSNLTLPSLSVDNNSSLIPLSADESFNWLPVAISMIIGTVLSLAALTIVLLKKKKN